MQTHDVNLSLTIFFIVLSLLLVAINGFFVASEFAIVKVRRTRLQELEGKGVASARISILMVDELDEYLSATQLGITLVSLALGWIGEESFYNLFLYLLPQSIVTDKPLQFHFLALSVSFFVITMLHVVLGELVPKSMAIQRAEKITLLVSRPLMAFYKFAKPLISAFTSIANFILKLLGYTGHEEESLSEEELRMVLKDSHDDGVISESEAKIINRAFEFSDKLATDIMIEESEVLVLSTNRSLDENLITAKKKMHTRFPLVQSNFQDIIGIVHMKDALLMLLKEKNNEAFKKVARPVLYIQPGMQQDKIMRLFKDKRTHIAVVRDETRKKNLGIVTLEDILEGLVGEIIDEHGN